jgi:hypothetical protein
MILLLDSTNDTTSTYLATATAGTFMNKVNNLIYHTYLDDSEVDFDVQSTTPLIMSYPVAFCYLVIKFLRDEISSTYRSGDFMSGDQWTKLSTAGESVLVN